MARTAHATGVVSTNSYVEVPGSLISTHQGGEKNVAYRFGATTAGLTFKVQGRLLGGTWFDLTGLDEAGSAHAGTELAVAASAQDQVFISEHMTNLALALFSEFRLMVKSTVADTPGAAAMDAIAK